MIVVCVGPACPVDEVHGLEVMRYNLRTGSLCLLPKGLSDLVFNKAAVKAVFDALNAALDGGRVVPAHRCKIVDVSAWLLTYRGVQQCFKPSMTVGSCLFFSSG